MSGPPSPERDAALPRDPWADQAQRRAEVAHRRRRRRRWVGGVVVALVVATVAIVVLVVVDGGSTEDSVTSSVATTVAPPTTAPATTVFERGVELAELDEVWLLDRGDGAYEWGLTVRSTATVDRGPFRIDASLRDDDRDEVGRVVESVGELPAGGSATVGGVVDVVSGVPTRLVVDVEVGDPLDEPALPEDALEIVALTRRTVTDRGGAPADVITGRIRSAGPTEVDGLQLALLWRGERDEVVGAVFHDVARVRPGIDARFEIPVPDLPGLDGLPVEISWSR